MVKIGDALRDKFYDNIGRKYLDFLGQIGNIIESLLAVS